MGMQRSQMTEGIVIDVSGRLGSLNQTHQVHMMPVFIGALEQGDVGVACQMVHDLHLASHILHILC